MTRDDLLQVMRADAVPAGERELWLVRKWKPRRTVYNNAGQPIPPGNYTSLCRVTNGTLHLCGETVMSDDPVELSRHLEPAILARGRVLVTGLGLGCVLRGMLANPHVDFIDVVERDLAVLDLVAPHLGAGRFQIHYADAMEFVRGSSQRWDFAWHDLWADTDSGEPHLAIIHQRLILALRGRVRWQGAWAFPRHLRRVLRERFPTSAAWVRSPKAIGA